MRPQITNARREARREALASRTQPGGKAGSPAQTEVAVSGYADHTYHPPIPGTINGLCNRLWDQKVCRPNFHEPDRIGAVWAMSIGHPWRSGLRE